MKDAIIWINVENEKPPYYKQCVVTDGIDYSIYYYTEDKQWFPYYTELPLFGRIMSWFLIPEPVMPDNFKNRINKGLVSLST